MRYLLDTNILIWSLSDLTRMHSIIDLLENPANDVYFSSASIWEIAIKHQIGKLDFSESTILESCYEAPYLELPILPKHILEIASLSYPSNLPPHRNPFDRILIAQAKSEGLTLLTGDKKIRNYTEPFIRLIEVSR